MLPRSTTVEIGRSEGRDVVTKLVRASSKPGAMVTARIDALSEIPLRSQRVIVVENLSNDRVLDKWKVEIKDTEDLRDIGR